MPNNIETFEVATLLQSNFFIISFYLFFRKELILKDFLISSSVNDLRLIILFLKNNFFKTIFKI